MDIKEQLCRLLREKLAELRTLCIELDNQPMSAEEKKRLDIVINMYLDTIEQIVNLY